jgi:hypothetical protein
MDWSGGELEQAASSFLINHPKTIAFSSFINP